MFFRISSKEIIQVYLNDASIQYIRFALNQKDTEWRMRGTKNVWNKTEHCIFFSLNRQRRLMRKSFEYSKFMVNVITSKQESLLYGETLTFCRRHSIELGFIRRCNFQETTRTRTINGFFFWFSTGFVCCEHILMCNFMEKFYCQFGRSAFILL